MVLKLTANRILAEREDTPAAKSTERAGKLKRDLLHRRRVAKRALIDARREKNAIEHIIQLPDENESLHFVIDGRFEPCDLIPATRRLSDPAVIDDLVITTLGLNSDNIATIARGLDQGKIKRATVIVSHYFKKAEPALYEMLRSEIEPRGGKVYGLRTHSKLILMEMSDGRCFTIEGSGNLRSCKSVEQFCFSNDRDLLSFHRTWLADFIASTSHR